MTEQELQAYIQAITPADRAAMDAAEKRQAELAKPPGSLGELETISVRLAGITGQVCTAMDKCRVAVFAADNGVVDEGVSCAPRSVTRQQAVNMTRHVTGMSSLAACFGDQVAVVDVGMEQNPHCDAILDRHIRRTTGNIAREDAMTRQQALDALAAGMEQAALARRDGVTALGIGEMGIGNTTTACAVASVLLGRDPAALVGRGSGLSNAAFLKKIQVLHKAVARNHPDPADPVGVLTSVGGLDLAALCGLCLGGAFVRLPVLLDGFIADAAALCAVRLCPAAGDALLASHVSAEPGAKAILEGLGLSAPLCAGLRLGEGSGAVMALPLLDMALAVYHSGHTFGALGIDAYTPQH